MGGFGVPFTVQEMVWDVPAVQVVVLVGEVTLIFAPAVR